MKILDTLLASLFLCISSLPLITLILALQRDAMVPANPVLGPDQVNEIQQLLIDHDPRQLLASDYQEVRLTETEVNALLTYIKNSNPALDSLNINVDLVQDGATFNFSLPVSAFGMMRYFNLVLHFVHVDDGLSLDQVDAGALSLPALLLAPMGQALASRLSQEDNYQLVSTFINSLHFLSINEERVVILLDWQEDNLELLGDQARQVFVSAREAERLIYYHDKLVDTINGLPAGITTVGLNDLLRPLFVFASANTEGGANPIAENRAIFIVLSSYMTDQDLSQLIGADVELGEPGTVSVRIENREDLARHVVTSAAIAASAGATMAEVLSVYKEVHDSRFRTGFSFTDIAANQAGTLLGALASRSEVDAGLFQQQMRTLINEQEFMPVLGTYDGMSEAEFIEQYGSRESAAYRQRLIEITDNITAQPFYQAF